MAASSRRISSESFTRYLAKAENDPYRDASGTMVQADGCITLTNSNLDFTCVFTVVPPSKVPNSRSGVILGQRGFLNRMTRIEIPGTILEARGKELKENEWGDINIMEWKDPMTDKIVRF
jgi:hypothetical protein